METDNAPIVHYRDAPIAANVCGAPAAESWTTVVDHVTCATCRQKLKEG